MRTGRRRRRSTQGPANGPVPGRLGDVALKAPVARSSVPGTVAVNVARLVVNVIVPAKDATVPDSPVIWNDAAVVPWSRPPSLICATVRPSPRSWPTPVASTLWQAVLPKATAGATAAMANAMTSGRMIRSAFMADLRAGDRRPRADRLRTLAHGRGGAASASGRPQDHEDDDREHGGVLEAAEQDDPRLREQSPDVRPIVRGHRRLDAPA